MNWEENMFYKFLRSTVRIIFWIINGHLHIHNSNYIPEENYILAAPHRTWWEPFLFAIAAKNTEFVVIAKKELFKNPIYKFLLKKHTFGLIVLCELWFSINILKVIRSQ